MIESGVCYKSRIKNFAHISVAVVKRLIRFPPFIGSKRVEQSQLNFSYKLLRYCRRFEGVVNILVKSSFILSALKYFVVYEVRKVTLAFLAPATICASLLSRT